ncbi:hypothetical protein HQ571_00635 [Candidatus Kuenenbacteria bacterium]|nr:hypothetical protein [Candidatus Kuenenbacteria bacterium]
MIVGHSIWKFNRVTPERWGMLTRFMRSWANFIALTEDDVGWISSSAVNRPKGMEKHGALKIVQALKAPIDEDSQDCEQVYHKIELKVMRFYERWDGRSGVRKYVPADILRTITRCLGEFPGEVDDSRLFEDKVCLELAKWESSNLPVIIDDVAALAKPANTRLCRKDWLSALKGSTVRAVRGSIDGTLVLIIGNCQLFAYDDSWTLGIKPLAGGFSGAFSSLLSIQDRLVDSVVEDVSQSSVIDSPKLKISFRKRGGTETYELVVIGGILANSTLGVCTKIPIFADDRDEALASKYVTVTSDLRGLSISDCVVTDCLVEEDSVDIVNFDQDNAKLLLKNWSIREGDGTPVSQAMEGERALLALVHGLVVSSVVTFNSDISDELAIIFEKSDYTLIVHEGSLISDTLTEPILIKNQNPVPEAHTSESSGVIPNLKGTKVGNCKYNCVSFIGQKTLELRMDNWQLIDEESHHVNFNRLLTGHERIEAALEKLQDKVVSSTHMHLNEETGYFEVHFEGADFYLLVLKGGFVDEDGAVIIPVGVDQEE